jgi:hypothetical protein
MEGRAPLLSELVRAYSGEIGGTIRCAQEAEQEQGKGRGCATT